jgi:glycosyltransferase involved in cell wall biosynthesis
MNICFLAGTLGRGGAERQLFFMLRALKDEGLTPKLFCLTKGEAFEPEIRELGIEVEWVGQSGNRLQRLRKIHQAVRASDPGLIQSAHFYTNSYAGVVSKLLGIPSIGAIRNDLISELRANRAFGKLHLKLPDHLVANSSGAIDNAVANGIPANRLHLVANVVERRRPEANGSRSRPNDSFTFLFAGRLAPQKRPELFIKLAEQLYENMPERDLRFLILGEGALRRELEAKAAATRLPAMRFSFLGERQNVDEVFSAADALVLTSKFEGTPNVVLEAMSHGMPVIATRVGGIRDVVTETRGILVDPYDFDGLTRAAEKLVVDREYTRTLGKAGRRYVETSHSVNTLGQSLIGIYAKVLGRPINDVLVS